MFIITCLLTLFWTDIDSPSSSSKQQQHHQAIDPAGHRFFFRLHPQAMQSLLYILGLVGFLGTWGRTTADGTLGHLLHALYGADPYILPGTQSALIRKFTGLFPVGYLLDMLVVFFWCN